MTDGNTRLEWLCQGEKAHFFGGIMCYQGVTGQKFAFFQIFDSSQFFCPDKPGN
jgi:hypothetical protein